MGYGGHAVKTLASNTYTGVSSNQVLALPDLSPYVEVTLLINITAITAGNLVANLQQQDAFAVQFNMASSAALSTAGQTAVDMGIGGMVLGTQCQLQLAVTTGPVTFTVTVLGKT